MYLHTQQPSFCFDYLSSPTPALPGIPRHFPQAFSPGIVTHSCLYEPLKLPLLCHECKSVPQPSPHLPGSVTTEPNLASEVKQGRAGAGGQQRWRSAARTSSPSSALLPQVLLTSSPRSALLPAGLHAAALVSPAATLVSAVYRSSDFATVRYLRHFREPSIPRSFGCRVGTCVHAVRESCDPIASGNQGAALSA